MFQLYPILPVNLREPETDHLVLNIMKPHRKFELKEYDPNWVEEFNKKAQVLKSVFGDELLEIHHIGSTSIPGMVAKPQIDILILVRDFFKIKSLYEEIIKFGFTPRGTEYVGTGDEYFTEDTGDGRRLTSVHVFQKGQPKSEEDLKFRDYLRTHKEDRNLYISVKKDLYSKYHDNYSKYDSGKTDVIKEIKERVNK